MRSFRLVLPLALCLVSSVASAGGLAVPSYQAPQFTSPVQGVVAKIAFVAFDSTNGAGRMVVNIYPDQDSADALKPPLDQFGVSLGEVLVPANPNTLPPTPAKLFLSLPALKVESKAAQGANPALDPMDAIGAVLYTHLLDHPRLKGAQVVP